jgi:hypothetical protein
MRTLLFMVVSICFYVGNVFGDISLNPVADHAINGSNVVGYNTGWATVSDQGSFCFAETYAYLEDPDGTHVDNATNDSGMNSAAAYGTSTPPLPSQSGSWVVEAISEVESTSYSCYDADWDYFTI